MSPLRANLRLLTVILLTVSCTMPDEVSVIPSYGQREDLGADLPGHRDLATDDLEHWNIAFEAKWILKPRQVEWVGGRLPRGAVQPEPLGLEPHLPAPHAHDDVKPPLPDDHSGEIDAAGRLPWWTWVGIVFALALLAVVVWLVRKIMHSLSRNATRT